MLRPEIILKDHGPDWLKSGLFNVAITAFPDWSQISIKTIYGGLTNQNYLFSVADNKFVLRIGSDNSDALALDREAEYKIHQHVAACGLVRPILYRSESDKFWLREYIQGKELQQADLSPATIRLIADAFVALHALPIEHDIPVLSLQDKAKAYWSIIQAQSDTSECLLLRDQIDNVLQQNFSENKLALCHLDPVLNNWLQTEAGLQLLDWEYAALANPLLDYAAFAQAAELDNVQQHELVATLQPAEADWLLAQKQMQLLSLLWYKAQSLISAEEFIQQCQLLINTRNPR